MVVLFTYMMTAVVLGFFVMRLKSNKLKRIYLFSMFFFAFLYSGLRGETVGLDTTLFKAIFDNIASNGLVELPRNTEVEKGYMVVNYILSRMGFSSQAVIILESAVICCSFYNIIKKYSKNYALSALIFISMIFTVTMNVARQYVALAFLLYAFDAILEKKPKLAVVFILLATSMHYSAIVMMPLALFALPRFNITRKSFFAMGLVSFLMIPLYMVVVNLFVSVFEQYSRFVTSSKYSAELEVSLQYIVLFIMVALLGFMCIKPFRMSRFKIKFSRKKTDRMRIFNEDELQQYLLFFLLFIEYVVMYFISRRMSIASRFLYYFQSSLVIMIPNTIWYLKKRYKSRWLTGAVTGAFVVYFVWFGYRYFAADPHGIFPYVFFWE